MPTSPRRPSRVLLPLLVATLAWSAGQPLAGLTTGRAAQVVPNFPALTFVRQPDVAVGGVAFARQPVIHDVDIGGNPRADEPVTIGIIPGSGAPGASLVCNAMTILTDTSGDATFTDCFIDRAGTGYRLSAQVLTVSSKAWASDPFDVIVGPPSRLGFVTPPVEAFDGHPFDLVVGITDAGGNLITSGVSASVSLSLGSDASAAVTFTCPGGVSRQTSTTGPGGGTATFSDCTLNDPAASGELIELVATASDVSGGPPLQAGQSPGIPLYSGTEAPLPALVVVPSPTVLTWGQPLTLAITFAGGASRLVEIQDSLDGTTWAAIGHVATDGAGRATFVNRPRTTRLFRAVFAGPPVASAGASETSSVLVRLLATQAPVTAGAVVLRRGTAITFATTVRPVGVDVPAARVAFLLYRRTAAGWHLTATRVVAANASGVARLTWRFGTAGEWFLRSKALGTWHGDAGDPGANVESFLTSIARYTVR
jgi:hypothetical protein